MNTFDAYQKVMLALTLWREARGTTKEAKLAVLWVILNRQKDPRWPNTFAEVVLQPKQFSCYNLDDPNATKLPHPKNGLEWAAWEICCELVDSPGIADPTVGSNHYHSLPPTAPQPSWATPDKMTAQIGPFKFFKL